MNSRSGPAGPSPNRTSTADGLPPVAGGASSGGTSIVPAASASRISQGGADPGSAGSGGSGSGGAGVTGRAPGSRERTGLDELRGFLRIGGTYAVGGAQAGQPACA